MGPADRVQYTVGASLAIRTRENRGSAEVVLPLLLNHLSPTSMVDVGCGVGTWLSVAAELGIREIHGVDAKDEDLDIPVECFTAHDLETELSLNRSFDLAMSLEVAEHLSPAAGKRLVATLVTLAPVVVFSAAIPGQPGTRHMNCRWQDEWADDFAEWGYVATDPIRPLVWDDNRVSYFYGQNLLVYVRDSHLGRFPNSPGMPLRVVHPRLYDAILDLAPGRLGQLLAKPAARLRAL